jgi:L-fuculose-phosphate aldolase
MAEPETLQRQRIVEAGKRLHDRFFVASNDGNISSRLSEDRYLITPTNVNKGDLRPEDLLLVDGQGRVLSGARKPTSEMKMHLAIYRQRADVKAVVHAHPPAATGFAACRIRLDQDVLLPEVIFSLGRIGFAEYGTPTTEEIPQAVEKEIANCEALLLANHGALTVGEEVLAAYYRMEVLEMYARVRLVTRLLGEPKALSAEQVRELERVRQAQGWGRGAAGEPDPGLIGIITQVVLEVLKGATPPGSGSR